MYHTSTKGLFSDSAILLMCRLFNLDALEEICPQVDSCSVQRKGSNFWLIQDYFLSWALTSSYIHPKPGWLNLVFNIHITMYVRRSSAFIDSKLSWIVTSLDSSFSPVLWLKWEWRSFNFHIFDKLFLACDRHAIFWALKQNFFIMDYLLRYRDMMDFRHKWCGEVTTFN